MIKKTKIGAYLRVSTQEQANEGFSIDSQKNNITQFCNFRGYEIYDWYIDAGYSGKDTIHRNEYNRMISDMKKGKFEKVVVVKLDRIGRNLKNFLEFLDILNDCNCGFESINGDIDLSSLSGRLLAQILSSISEFERGLGVERTTMCMEEAAHQGHFGGKPPLGYKKEVVNGVIGKKWVIDEKEAPIVKEIFELCYKGNTYNTIANIMQEKYSDMIAYTRKDKITGEEITIPRSWTDASICTILNNKTYYGTREHRKNMKNKKVIELKNIVPAIISEELFNDCQEIIIRNKRNYYRNKRYLFMQKLVCPKCGRIMACKGTKKKTGEEYLYYKCKDCKTNFREDLIEDALAEELTSMLELYLVLESNFVPIDTETANELSKGKVDNTIRYALDSIMIDNRLYLDGDTTRKFWDIMNYEVKCSFIYEYIDKIKIKKHQKNGKPYIEILDIQFRSYVIKKFKEMFEKDMLDDIFLKNHNEISMANFKHRYQADEYLKLLSQKYNIRIYEEDIDEWSDGIFKIISVKNKCVCDKNEVLYVELLPQTNSILDKLNKNICEGN